MDLRLAERYTITSEWAPGAGPLVRVAYARDHVLDLPVVVKVLRPELAADAGVGRAFAAALQAAGRITHPNLVPMHDAGETPDGLPFVAWARAEGGSFADLVARPPPWTELLGLVQSVLAALAHLHARGQVHGRIKPTNLLLHPDGDGGRRLWLADAGLAAISARVEPAGTRSPYEAPEQRATPSEIGPPTDLYALGRILWELVTGRPPAAPGEPLPPWTPAMEVPARLEAVFANLLCADPLGRYDLAADLRTELDSLESGAPNRAAPSRPPEALVPTPVSVRLFGSAPADRRAEPARVNRVAEPLPSPSSTAERAAERVRVNRDPPSTPLDRPEIWDGSESPGLWVRGRENQVPSDDISDLLSDEELEAPGPVTWNCPPPPPLPPEPPLEAGLGATARASLRLFAGREIPLVGRESEVRELWSAARQVAADRRAKVVVVVGDAGSGRTRLLRSVTRTLEERGHAETVWMAYGDPITDDDGYAGAARALLRPSGSTRDALEARLRRRLTRERPVTERSAEEVRSEAAALARWCEIGGDEATRPGERPVPHAWGLREVFRHLGARSWRNLGCLVLDDARWATEPGDGLDIADAVIDRDLDATPSMPLLVLVSVRTGDLVADPELSARVDRWVSRGALRIDLAPLGIAETDALVEEGVTLSSDLRHRVLNRCAGNPLVARQLVLAWVDRDALVPDPGGPGFVLRDPAEPVPADLPSLLDHRLDALAGRSGLARRFVDLVHLVALAGRSVPRGLVDGFAGPELEAFVHGCGLWHAATPDAATPDRLVFESTTVHQHLVAVAEGRPDAAYLHRRLGRAWGRLVSERGAALEAGRHGVLANDAAFGVPWLLRAAEASFSRERSGALYRASRLATGAIDADPSLSPLRGRAMLARARSLVARDLVPDATVLFVAACDVLVGTGDTLVALDAFLGLGAVRLRAGDVDAAEWLYTDAANRARQASAPRHEALATTGRGRVELHKRAFAAADELFGRAAGWSRQLGDLPAAGDALLGQARVALRTGRFAEAESLYAAARGRFLAGWDLAGGVRAGLGLAEVAYQRETRGPGGPRWVGAAAEAQSIGHASLLAEARLGIARASRGRGDIVRAERIAVDLAERATATSAPELGVGAALLLARLALDGGELGAAYDQTAIAARWLERLPGHPAWSSYRLVVATLLAHRRDHTSTWQWLWSAQEVGLAEAVDRDVAAGLVSICEVAAEAGWANVVRLAGKIGAEQLERLNDEHAASRLKQMVATALL